MSQNEIRRLLDEAVKNSRYPLVLWERLIEGMSDEGAFATMINWRWYAFYGRTDIIARFNKRSSWYDTASEKMYTDERYARYRSLSDSEKIAYLVGDFRVIDLGDGLYVDIVDDELYAESSK